MCALFGLRNCCGGDGLICFFLYVVLCGYCLVAWALATALHACVHEIRAPMAISPFPAFVRRGGRIAANVKVEI